MLSNLLKDRVLLVEKQVTEGALGQTITYVPIQRVYAQVKPLSVQARAQYQQLHSLVTHEILLRGAVDISLGNNRIKHGSKVYEPVEPAKVVNGNTLVVCQEL